MSSRQKSDGAGAFEAFYREQFGDRWAALRQGLLEPVRHIGWQEKLSQPYYLDPGSVAAVMALPPVTGGSILDMCAAPGGKTLVLAGRMDADTVLVANEFSRDRKNRLISVLDTHLGPDVRARITVTGRDASRWSRYEQDAYERILLDAPCSSERHVLSSPAYLAEWSPARIKNLAHRQWALLSGAWLVLKNGGFLLYSTCALCPRENDDIIARLLKKYPDARVVGTAEQTADITEGCFGEPTSFGRHILPDTASGAGPLYYSLVQKRNLSE